MQAVGSQIYPRVSLPFEKTLLIGKHAILEGKTKCYIPIEIPILFSTLKELSPIQKCNYFYSPYAKKG